MADFTKEWIEHLKGQIASRLNIVEDKLDPQTYDQLVTDLAWFTFWQPWYTAWSAVDLRAAALRRYAEIGLETPNFEERIRCYELAIGLDGLAYQAFAGHSTNLEWTTRRLLALV